MNDLKVFDYYGKNIRTFERKGELWWAIEDVCSVLGFKTSKKVLKKLENYEVSSSYVFNETGKMEEITVINETGLYSAIMRSDEPTAKKFKRWVTYNVLPSIRKRGVYTTVINDILKNLNFTIQQLSEMKEECEKEDIVIVSGSEISLDEFTMIIRQYGINMDLKQLIQWLRDNGYLIKNKDDESNIISQYSTAAGLFVMKDVIAGIKSDGSTVEFKREFITEKGRMYFIRKLLQGSQGKKYLLN